MHMNVALLLLVSFLDTLISFQCLIYAPFILQSAAEANGSDVNLYVAFFITAYTVGLVVGKGLSRKIASEKGRKIGLISNLCGCLFAVLLLSTGGGLFHCLLAMAVLGAFGNSWANVFGCIHESPLYSDSRHVQSATTLEFGSPQYNSEPQGDSSSALPTAAATSATGGSLSSDRLLWHLQFAHGCAIICAGIFGLFYAEKSVAFAKDSIEGGNDEKDSVALARKPMLLLAAMCCAAIGALHYHFEHRVNDASVNLTISKWLLSCGLDSVVDLRQSAHAPESRSPMTGGSTANGGAVTSVSSAASGLHSADAMATFQSDTVANADHLVLQRTKKKQTKAKVSKKEFSPEPMFSIEQEDSDVEYDSDGDKKEGRKHVLVLKAEESSCDEELGVGLNMCDDDLINEADDGNTEVTSSSVQKTESRQKRAVASGPLLQTTTESLTALSWLSLATQFSEGSLWIQVSATESIHSALREWVSELSVTLYSERMFLALMYVTLATFACLFSFDVLWPAFAAVSSHSGGMGWLCADVGWFYAVYGVCWLLVVSWRWQRLEAGQQWAASFHSDPSRSLTLCLAAAALMFGAVIPVCINSATIHHSEYSPSSWFFLGSLMAVLMAAIGAVAPYELTQLLFDYQRLCAESESAVAAASDEWLEATKTATLWTVSTVLVYARLCVPILAQWLQIAAMDLNYSERRAHGGAAKRDWYRVGNLAFYSECALCVSALFVLQIYQQWRRQEFGEAVERQHMFRLVEEVRRQRVGVAAAGVGHCHALGAWLSLSMRTAVTRQSALPVTGTLLQLAKDRWLQAADSHAATDRHSYEPLPVSL